MEQLAPYGLAALFVVMLLKESGVPVPVPSDLLMIGAGVQAAAGAFGVGDLALAILVAVAVGATIQFLLFRSFGRRLLDRVGGAVGLRPDRIEAAAS